MAEDIKVNNLIINQLSNEKFATIEKDPTQLYLTPDTSIDASEKGVAGGVATLDSSAKVPTNQIPALPYLPTSGGTVNGTIVATRVNSKSLQLGDSKTNESYIAVYGPIYIKNIATSASSTQIIRYAGTGYSDRVLWNADKAVPNGVASLGADGKVPAEQLPETVLPDNYDYVVDSYSDDNGNWYRVYKSGWLEQGGQLTNNSIGWHTVTFLKPFSFVYNLINSLVDAPVVQPTNDTLGPKQITNTNFMLYQASPGSNNWIAIGKGAENYV